MPHSKFSFFLIIFLLITVVTFVAELEAEEVSNEQERAITQEFIAAAQKFVELGEIDKAIEIYERIVKGTPEDLESRAQLATLYTRTNQHEKAAQTYSKLLEADPENIKYQDALVNSLQTAGKHNEALEIAQTYVQMQPEVGVHYARLARLYEAEGNEAAALANYKKATVFEYGDEKIYLRLAEHYFLNDDIDASEKALKNAMIYTTSKWDQERIERQLVNLYRYQGNLEEMLQKAEAEGTLTFEMQKQRARHFYNIGELEKAAVHLKKALEMTNSSYEQNKISNELLNVHLKQDSLDLALELYETEASKQTDSTYISTSFSVSGIIRTLGGDDARKTLINAYKNRGKLDVLRTLFEGKLEKDAANPAIIEMLAELYWDTNDYQKAAEAYHMLSKTKPMKRRNIRSFYHAAAAFHKSNQPDMVKAILNQADTELAASSNFKEDTSFLGALATICINSKMYAPAIKLADAAVTEAEASGDNWELEYLYGILAKSYLGAKRYKEAFEACQQVADVDENSYVRGRAEMEMNKIAKEGKLYEKWIPEQLKKTAENPNDPKPILKLAQSYEATDEIEEAIAQYEKLTELEPEKSQWHKKLGELYQNLPQESREIGTASDELSPEQLAKSIAAYEKAVELEPTSYQLYDLLAKSHIKSDRTSDAEKIYRRALDASLKQSEHDSAIRAIIQLYADEGQENKQIAFLEEIRQKLAKMDDSAVLHELLGDLYKKVGDSEKAELAYAKWLQIRQKALNSAQSAWSYHVFANKLLDKGLYPEIALNFAKRAFQKSTDANYIYPTTLGRACVANGLYDEALKHFKHALSVISDEHYSDMFWEEIAEAIKNANDKERYVQMLEALTNAIPVENSSSRANVYRTLAQFYSENNMPEKAENYLLKTGFVPETAWITLGTFDNKDNMGPYIAYIPEEATQIDTTAKYYGKDKLIRWQKVDDNKIDGMIWLGSDIDWTATYTWAIVSSPDERDITIRFDSDDQGIVWLNGKEVFRHDRMSGAQVDRYIVPVTLKQGENTVLLKVCNAEIYTYFFMRLTDVDGNPFKDLKFKNADELLNAPPPTKPIFHVNVNLGLAEYYSKNNMPDKAMEQIRQTGVIHENAWLVLGPFDNTVGIGYNTKYIPEGTTQIDLTAKYEGVNEQISWKKFTDAALNGFIDFGEDVNWRVSYAMATLTSPDEREVLFRFSSDDQSKIWLNGTEVFADANAQSAILDKNTIPVTLKTGKNTILVKVCNEEMSWGFYLRVTDVDGKPFKDLKINNVQDN
ncbi:MAG: tetratricopeptide repeat protein [Candidatus Poribacteria bacterium]|nr:tetratricopeptide repeat protein [Candidatus Poribacteria bacterium]